MTPGPEHIDAVARAIHESCDSLMCKGEPAQVDRDDARAILDSDDPAVHAAMLDALTRHGVLTEETRRANLWGDTYADQRRLVTPWEVAP